MREASAAARSGSVGALCIIAVSVRGLRGRIPAPRTPAARPGKGNGSVVPDGMENGTVAPQDRRRPEVRPLRQGEARPGRGLLARQRVADCRSLAPRSASRCSPASPLLGAVPAPQARRHDGQGPRPRDGRRLAAAPARRPGAEVSAERDREPGAGPAGDLCPSCLSVCPVLLERRGVVSVCPRCQRQFPAPGAPALGGGAAPATEAPAGLEVRIRRLEQEAADRAALVDSLARRVSALEAAAEGGV